MSERKHIPLGFIKKSVENGAHIVMLYENEADILRIFPPFFATGLKNNELCIIIYPNLRLKQKLKKKLTELVNLKDYIKEKKVEFVYYKNFYFKNNVFSKEKVYKLIDKKLNHIGFKDIDGIRAAGDMSWIKDKLLKEVLICAKEVTKKYRKAPVLLMCSYPIEKLSIVDLIDVIQSHNLILYKKDKKWYLSEPTERRVLKEEIQDLERFTKLAVGRELDMIKLKKKIAKLEKQLKRR
nr:MEDS domain-containing protein [Nanoarchaeota archaeon]